MEQKSKGLGTGAIIGIVAGVVVVLGGGGYLAYRMLTNQAGEHNSMSAGDAIADATMPNVDTKALAAQNKQQPYVRTEGGKINQAIYKKDFKDKSLGGKAVGLVALTTPVGLIANVASGRAWEKLGFKKKR